MKSKYTKPPLGYVHCSVTFASPQFKGSKHPGNGFRLLKAGFHAIRGSLRSSRLSMTSKASGGGCAISPREFLSGYFFLIVQPALFAPFNLDKLILRD